ncbi:aminotransferase class III-fold pyridoxal phosphate-dependent enzyme, partial [Enterobacter cloacae]|uniref:aminotransferase class III-fold pyridoxal phosphate-dependent enzyme n=1 Tax=Enterobacter cloacae TaxID=550 RepID=UPI0013D34F8F
GHPVAGMVARPDILETFGRRTRYFNTFGGNPVSCAVGMAVLDVIEEQGLVANAKRVGTRLMDGLRQIAKRHE